MCCESMNSPNTLLDSTVNGSQSHTWSKVKKKNSHDMNNCVWERTKLKWMQLEGFGQIKHMITSPIGSEAVWLLAGTRQVKRDMAEVLRGTAGG